VEQLCALAKVGDPHGLTVEQMEYLIDHTACKATVLFGFIYLFIFRPDRISNVLWVLQFKSS
jgi:hypothetical protein